jgi:hypothetical protein
VRIAGLLLIVVALASGCANTAVGVSSGAGTTVASGGAITTTSSAAALALVLTFGVLDYASNPQPFPSPSSFFAPSQPAPEMAANRRISEQDCSRPVDLSLGNLRCK